MPRSLVKRLGYTVLQLLTRTVGVLFFRVRVLGRGNVPTSGGGVVCANHQSYLDPLLVGLAVDRRMNYLARDTLFHNRVLRHIMKFLDTIPIDREGSGLAGLKETLRRLKANELVLIFPEGTRTRDGNLQPLKAGFCSVARRSGQPLIPVGLDGAYQAWPRTSSFPRPATFAIVIGETITPQQIRELSDEALVRELQRRMEECLTQARAMRKRRFLQMKR